MNLDEVEVTEVEARVEVNMGQVEVNLAEVEVNLDRGPKWPRSRSK